MDDPELLGAYLLYYWPVSYVEVSLALAELGASPRRVLDLGSGPGPAAAAALDAGATRLVLADGSEPALGLARRLLGAQGASVETVALDLESAAGPGAGLPGVLADAHADAAPFDLVVLGHCLNELWRGRPDRRESRLALLERAADLLAPGGAVLVVEPALLATSREALEQRDALAAAGYPILAPCPGRPEGSYPCPILPAGPDRTCHAEAAWDPPEPVAALAQAAGLDRRSVKSTWFAFGRAAEPRPASGPAPEPSPFGRPGQKPALRGRVVSDPMLNKAGRVRYFLCAEGSLVSLSARKDSPEARASGFLSLRRGDLVRVAGAEARPGGGLGIVAGTELELLGRAPAP